MIPNIKQKKSQIKSFSIKNLFGYKDIHIPFEKEALILIAENGSGKTTILNSLYYLLACKFEKLSDIEFDSMSGGRLSGSKCSSIFDAESQGHVEEPVSEEQPKLEQSHL